MTKRQRAKYLFNLKMSDVETEIKVVEKRYCSHFGCNRELSITEQLYNDRCPNHQKTESKLFSNGKL